MRRSARSALRALLVLVVAFAASGCTVLADEFTWLDRAAPDSKPRDTTPVDGLRGNP